MPYPKQSSQQNRLHELSFEVSTFPNQNSVFFDACSEPLYMLPWSHCFSYVMKLVPQKAFNRSNNDSKSRFQKMFRSRHATNIGNGPGAPTSCLAHMVRPNLGPAQLDPTWALVAEWPPAATNKLGTIGRISPKGPQNLVDHKYFV